LEDPPGHAHGGSIFTVLDETMGLAAWSAGCLALAASITVHFKRKVPLGTDAVVEAWVCRAQGRKVSTHASLRDPQNACICAEAEGLYITQHPDQFATIRILPEQFRKQAEHNTLEFYDDVRNGGFPFASPTLRQRSYFFVSGMALSALLRERGLPPAPSGLLSSHVARLHRRACSARGYLCR